MFYNPITELSPAFHALNIEIEKIDPEEPCTITLPEVPSREELDWVINRMRSLMQRTPFTIVLPPIMKTVSTQFAFNGLCRIPVFVLPESVEYLYGNSLAGLKTDRLELPASLVHVEPAAFTSPGCLTNIAECVVSPQNRTFCVKNGMLLSIDGKTLIGCIVHQCKEYIVPDGVEKIGPYAFANIYRLVNNEPIAVHLPESLVEIEDHAFMNVPVKCNFPQSLRTIGHEAFKGCSMAGNFIGTVPYTVKNIAKTAFDKRKRCVVFASKHPDTYSPSRDDPLYTKNKNFIRWYMPAAYDTWQNNHFSADEYKSRLPYLNELRTFSVPGHLQRFVNQYWRDTYYVYLEIATCTTVCVPEEIPTQKYKDGFSKFKNHLSMFPKAQALLALYIERILSADRDNMPPVKMEQYDNIFSGRTYTYEFPLFIKKKSCMFILSDSLVFRTECFADDFIFPIQQIEKIPSFLKQYRTGFEQNTRHIMQMVKEMLG